MADLIERPDDLVALRARTTEELRAELAGQLRLTAGHLLRLATIIRVLEERGEDLRSLRAPLLPYLRLIAHGQCLPEVVVRFVDRPLLIQRIRALPVPDQDRLGSGQPVRLVVPAPEGEREAYTHRMVSPGDLDREQITQVFAPHGLRDVPAQIAWLESRRAQKPRTPTARKKNGVRPDKDRQGLVVGRTFIPRDELIEALANLRSEGEGEGEGDSGDGSPVALRLSEAEHRALKVAAAQSGRTMSELVRQALRATGLI